MLDSFLTGVNTSVTYSICGALVVGSAIAAYALTSTSSERKARPHRARKKLPDNKWNHSNLDATSEGPIPIDSCVLRWGNASPRPSVFCINGFKIDNVSCGSNHVLFLSKPGKVYSMGDGAHGTLGHNDLKPRSSPTLVKKFDSEGVFINRVVTAYEHNIALTDDGLVYTWGNNTACQTGIVQNSPTCVMVPTFVKSLQTETIINASCGAFHSLLLKEDGTLVFFGGAARHRRFLAPKSSTVSIMSVSCGIDHNLLLTEDRKVLLYQVNMPPFSLPIGGQKALKVASGAAHSVVLCDNGTVYTLGSNNKYGQLGTGHRTHNLADDEFLIPGITTAVDVFAYGYTSWILTQEGDVLSFGKGAENVLGHNSNENQFTPKLVEKLYNTRITKILCSSKFTIGCIGQVSPRPLRELAMHVVATKLNEWATCTDLDKKIGITRANFGLPMPVADLVFDHCIKLCSMNIDILSLLRHSHIRKACLFNVCERVTDDWLEILSTFGSLEELDIRFCRHITVDGIKKLDGCKSLKSLYIHRSAHVGNEVQNCLDNRSIHVSFTTQPVFSKPLR